MTQNDHLTADCLKKERKKSYRISLSFQSQLEAAIQKMVHEKHTNERSESYRLHLTIADQPYKGKYELLIEDVGDFLSDPIRAYIWFDGFHIHVYVTADIPSKKVKPPHEIQKLLTYKNKTAALSGEDCIKRMYIAIDLSGLDTSEVEDMSCLFAGCSLLSELNISTLDTSKVKNIESMFEGCKRIREIDISAFDMDRIKNTNRVFDGCLDLKRIIWDPKEISEEKMEINISDVESIACDPMFDKAWWLEKKVKRNPASLFEKIYKVNKDRALRLIYGAQIYEDTIIRESLAQTKQEQQGFNEYRKEKTKNKMMLPADCCNCALYEEPYCLLIDRFYAEVKPHDTCRWFIPSEFSDEHLRYEEDKNE